MPKIQQHAQEPAFVSQQVSESRRYYLDLDPSRQAALTVVCGGVERMRPDYLVERRDFPYFAVEFVAEGRGTLELNGRRHPLSPGTVFAYGPGVTHSIQNDPRSPMRKYYVDFAGTDSRTLLQRSGLGKWNVLFVGNVPSLAESFEDLAQEATGNDPVTRSLCEMRLRILLLKIEQIAVSASRDMPRAFATYNLVRTHIESHFLRLDSIQEVARECHVSAVHISRLFSRFNRAGAHHFLTKLKMNRAAELLLDEGLLVKEAAERLGYPDAFQFSRTFKRVYGVPPARLLASRRARDDRPTG